MLSYSSIINPPPAVILSANAELQSHGAPSSHIITFRKHRASPVHSVDVAKGSVSLLQVPPCKFKDMTELSSKGAFIASPPTLPPSPTVTLSPLPSVKHLRIPGFVFLMCQKNGLKYTRQQYDSLMLWLVREKLIALRLVDTIQIRASDTVKRRCVQRLSEGRKGFLAFIVAIFCLTCPTIVVTGDISIGISNNVALAQNIGQSIGQIRQAALFLERYGGSTSTKVLDKVVTVISGQTMVTPETIDKLKSIIEGEKDPTDLQTDFANNAETWWSTTVDVISQFNPISLVEATGNGIQGLVEAGAERFAAFELSTLVALGERWVLWTPFVILPMYWQMTRNKKSEENDREKSQAVAVELSKEAVAKAARVRDELERIELKASLLDLVYSLGKLAWQSSGTDQSMKRRQIDELLTRLQDLNPTSSSDLGSALVKVPSAESPYMQTFVDVDGEWNLIYVSQDSSQGERTQFAQLLGLNIPGFEVSNMRQKLWRQGLKTALSTSESEVELLVAKNTAELRLGPLGVVEISVQGSWENQSNGKSALVSFQTFSAKPVEVLGSRVREDLPPLDLAIPSTLQTSGEWKTVYLDNSLRINRGRTGQLFLFRKSL